MRTRLCLLVIVCTIWGWPILFGCGNNPPTPTIESRIVGKWTMKTAIGTYSQLGGTPSTSTTSFTSSDFFDFKADGTIHITEGGKNYNGKWMVDGNKIFFTETNYIDYLNGFEIKVLTTSDLQIYYNEIKQVATSEQTLNLAK